jgi:hypothetical protein
VEIFHFQPVFQPCGYTGGAGIAGGNPLQLCRSGTAGYERNKRQNGIAKTDYAVRCTNIFYWGCALRESFFFFAFLTESSKSPASNVKIIKWWVGTCLCQVECHHLAASRQEARASPDKQRQLLFGYARWSGARCEQVVSQIADIRLT